MDDYFFLGRGFAELGGVGHRALIRVAVFCDMDPGAWR